MDPSTGQEQKTAGRVARALRLALNAAALAVVCGLSTAIGDALKLPPNYVSPVWPTGPILFSVLVVTPTRQWWIYIVAAYSSQVIHQAWLIYPPGMWALFTIAGIAEFLIAAPAVRRFANGIRAFESLGSLVVYLLVGAVAPFASAWLAAFAAAAGNYWFYWRVWFLADAMGYLTIAPAILTLLGVVRQARWNVSPASTLEAILVACALILICARVFDWPLAGQGSIPALVYLPLPLLLWAAVRFGPLGAGFSLLTVASLSIFGAVHGRGPFAVISPSENVLALQLFLATVSLPLLLLAALIQEGHEKSRVLGESEARFRSLADSAPVLIWVSGPDKLCTYLSKGWLDFTGRTLVEELGSGWADSVHPDDRAGCLAVYERAFDARQEFSMEYRLRRHDGQYRWVWDRGIPRFAADGSFFGYIGCADDITERRQTEQALEANQHELQLLSGQLLQAQETERRRIARELHDDLNQDLALLSVELDLLGQKPPASLDQLRTSTRELSARVKQLSSAVHSLSHQLHPAKLEQLGLGPAIKGLCQELSQNYGLTID